MSSADHIANVHIYREPRCRAIDFEAVAAGIGEWLPRTAVTLRAPLLEGWLENASAEDAEALAMRLAEAKVRSFDRPARTGQRVLPGEVGYELRRLQNRDGEVYGILYDAWLFTDAVRMLLPAAEARLENVHVIFTNQLIGTWDLADRRYHARTVVCGAPSILSTSGMVEAPARAPGYYLARRSSEALGLQEEEKMELARSYAGDCLRLDDPRLTDAAQGLVMQAVTYRLTGEPFCDDRDCRLFNAHWQSDLIRTQTGGGYCTRHAEMFARLQA